MMLIIVYLALGYWATGKVVYANKVVFYTGYTFFTRMNKAREKENPSPELPKKK